MVTQMSSQPFITVVEAGLSTSIQDLGRYGHRHIGMPTAGAMDSYSFKQANYLVGNPIDTACLECTLVGPTLLFSDECSIAITGADMSVSVDGERIPLNQTVNIAKGSTLSFKSCGKGCRTYLAVSGGFSIKPQLGSVSTYSRACIGGINGAVLKKGDKLGCSSNSIASISRKLPERVAFMASSHYRLRVIVGPEFNAFTKPGVNSFLNSDYTVSAELDRMGCRLNGAKIEHNESADILSASVQFGTVQVPANGLPIILLADSQTTGGYTRIANVASIDLPILGQLRPGNTISFELIELSVALELFRHQNKDFPA